MKDKCLDPNSAELTDALIPAIAPLFQFHAARRRVGDPDRWACRRVGRP
jgi:hypothetical protein